MGSPSIFTKSPQEHCQATKVARRKYRRAPVRYMLPPPPPGYVRVHFHSDIENLRKGLAAEIESDAQLELSGELDLEKVKMLWGLESCAPIDPMRWIVFEPGENNRLSAVAVRVLSEGHHVIQFFEPTVSELTLRKRACRVAVIGLIAWYMQLFSIIRFLFESYTPIPKWCRRAEARRMELAWRRKRWATKYETECRVMLQSFVSLVLLSFAGAVLGGYINFAIRQRVWNWARTGYFSL